MKKLNLLFTALLLLCCMGAAKAEKVTIDGIRYDVITKAKQATVISGGNYSGNIVIPSEITYNNVTCSVTSIGERAFYFCTGLTSITIPNSVTSIGSSAFYSCSGLKTVYNFSNLTFSKGSSSNGYIAYYVNKVYNAPNGSIEGDYIFGKPNNVNTLVGYLGSEAELTLPADYKGESYAIGGNVFKDNKTITSITIPNSVTSIGSGAFEYCTKLKEVHINDLAAWCSIDFYGYNANPLYYAQNLYLNNELITELVIPNGVTSIGDYAFYYFKGLTSITIPNSVTSIGNGAFYECYGLTSITIPNSVTSIGYDAFYWCSNLTSVEIGNSVTSIGEGAFKGCSELTSITIPNSVTSIGEEAFYSCTGLKSVTIGNSVTSIGSGAFYGCSGLTSITIPNSVTSIESSAFYSCYGLTSITIPNSVTSIGEWALANCDNLTDVYCLATNVPSTYGYAFSGSYPEYMTLHVPAEAINSYKTTKPWSSFGNIVTLDGEIVEPEEPEVKICATPVISYNNGKLSFECETEGAEFTTDVTCSDINKFYDNEINFSTTYNISVYATATGYDNSDTVNATLCWIECDCNENNNNNIINIPAKAVLVTSNNGTINISCSLEGENVAVYSSNAMFIGSATIENGCATIRSGLSKGDIAIVKIGEKSIKVIVD